MQGYVVLTASRYIVFPTSVGGKNCLVACVTDLVIRTGQIHVNRAEKFFGLFSYILVPIEDGKGERDESNEKSKFFIL